MFESRLLFSGQFALGMSVEISAIAPEHKHQQHFGIQARGRDVSGGQQTYRGFEAVAEQHPIIVETLVLRDTNARSEVPRTTRITIQFDLLIPFYASNVLTDDEQNCCRRASLRGDAALRRGIASIVSDVSASPLP